MNLMDGYLTALKDSEKISKKEFKQATNYSKQCDEIVGRLDVEFSKIVKKAEKVTTNDKLASNGLLAIAGELGSTYQVERAKQRYVLGQQKQVLSKFSIMLFGRTLAGKSTIREAITKGDGSTIGKGDQRTTRDVREYEWNYLRIIDTPGFGAYNGEEDTEIAHGVIEESDIILFMLNSDSIQESTFKELEYIYKLNKPLIFVINVKKDLQQRVYRKKAINDPEAYLYSADKLDGHKQRLRDKAAKLGMNPCHIHITPIHAQAAFLATQTQYSEQSEDLHRVSRLDELLSLLTDEITSKGRARRVQTLLGAALTHVGSLDKIVTGQRKSLGKLVTEYESVQKQVNKWHHRIRTRLPERIEKEVTLAFSPLKESISSFVDDNIQVSNFSERLEDHIATFDIKFKCEKIAQNIIEEVQQDLSQFNRDLERSIELNNKIEKTGNHKSFDPVDYKRMNGWASAITTVLSAIAISNGWNPVGWGFAGVGVLFGVLQVFSDSKLKKLHGEKCKRTTEIQDQITEHCDQTVQTLIAWFYEDIDTGHIFGVKAELRDLCTGFSHLCTSLEAATVELDELEAAINKRWLLRIMEVSSKGSYKKPEVDRIVRQPGYACYFKVSNYFKEPDLLRRMQGIAGERVKVVYDGAIEEMIRHALGINNNAINILKDKDGYSIYAPSDTIGKIIGKQHRNIMLASAICDVRLTAKLQEETSEVLV